MIEDHDMRQRLMEASNHQQWMMTAPVFIACVADLQCRIQNTRGIVLNEDTALPELKLIIIRDTTIAIEHLVIEAMRHDLGTVLGGLV
ncbi:nitroreductase [Candidatus Moduliflexus flocculans]|uniref:Nitroreductase n=1 Tax=Candidatus Moduliflexus flocculans TaxID=1499966 RepID=A0A081BMX7_9BACT|nr:nitroreductase [Candidatus Moduliflexus flocculans]